ncbi:RNA polymerase sigma factor [uncultured Aquimarina sp.]|uniref:RNA polymerase sigma factor n=1 Tax=uncultured Aquimarina sp. TaxID=575652 RepID=UPI002624614A|nr:RNA polymerase sigma factor [uncultured Aquimarina sp.]
MKAGTNTIEPDKWISNYYSFLKNYTRARISDPLDVEEIISETFLAALGSMHNFQHKCSEHTWLVSILKRKIVDYYRRQSSFKGKMLKYALSHEEYQKTYYGKTAIVDCDETTLSNMNLEALEYLLAESLKRMSSKQSSVAKMRIYDKLSTEEICKRLNISKNNAWVLMSRARKAIATRLNQFDYTV